MSVIRRIWIIPYGMYEGGILEGTAHSVCLLALRSRCYTIDKDMGYNER